MGQVFLDLENSRKLADSRESLNRASRWIARLSQEAHNRAIITRRAMLVSSKKIPWTIFLKSNPNPYNLVQRKTLERENILVLAVTFEPIDRFTPDFHQIDTKFVH